MRRILVQSVLLVAWSVATALGWNALSPWGVPLTRGGVFDIAAEKGGWRRISILDARDVYDQELTIFIDARPKDEYQRGTIQGSLFLPADEFDRYYYEEDFESKILMRGGGPGPMNADHIVFCSGGTCTDSVVVAEQLTELGYERVWVMEDGYDAWLNQDDPVEVPSEEEAF
jgi:rhodanese-related sulfurtransferase